MEPLKIFIGFDHKEIAAYQVCHYSILKNATKPVAIIPINIRHLQWFRNNDYKASTEFAFTRFLVPYLSGYKGASVFMDCDMLVRSDIHKLMDWYDKEYDVQVVKHHYIPKEGDKFLNQEQSTYRRKNWSSVMVFNNEKCKVLSPDYVNDANGLDLHQFVWTNNIGELPKSWNYLVGEPEVERQMDPDIAHFTLGGPYFSKKETKVNNPEAAIENEWWKYFREANSVLDVKVLGGINHV